MNSIFKGKCGFHLESSIVKGRCGMATDLGKEVYALVEENVK
jgi:hypothetical protein